MADDTTPTPRTSGIEDVSVSLAKRVGLLISSVAIQSLLAYALLPAGRGEYAVCILLTALLGVVFTPGADAGAQYFVMTKRISISQGVSTSLVICVIGAALSAAIAVPLIHSGVTFFQKAEPGSFYLALALVPVIAFSNAMQHHLVGLRRFARLALFSLMQAAANGLVAASLVLGLRLGVNGALIAVCIGDLVMIIVCFRDLRRHAGLAWETPSRRALGEVLRYGLKYHAARIGSSVDARFGVLLLGVLADRSEVGLFAVASALMMRFITISHSVAAPVLPRAAQHEEGHTDLVAFCARITTWVTGVALIVVLVLSAPLVRVLLSPLFLPVVPLIKIIAPGILVFAGSNVLISYFRAVNKPAVCSWAAGIGVASNVILVALLYPALGVEAAAWGLSAGLIVRSVAISVAYCRVTRTRLGAHWLLHRGDIARIAVSARASLSRLTGKSSVAP